MLESGYPEAIAAAVLAGLTDEEVGSAAVGDSAVPSLPEPVSSSESDTVPDATVEVVPAAQKSWLEDDLFAA